MLKPAAFLASHCSVSILKRVFASVVFAGLLVTVGATVAHAQKNDGVLSNEGIVNILEKGNLSQIDELIEDGLDINADLEGDGTPLIIAVRRGDLALVEYLLRKGAEVNVKTEQDANALITAALNNKLTLLSYLHKQGAELDAITEFDETALISASRAGHFQIVKYLVEQGANINLAVEANVLFGKEWRSPLSCAKTEEIRQYLIKQGASG